MISRAALFSLAASLTAAQILDIPTRVGDIISLPEPSVITGAVDFGNKEFDRGHPCDSDEDTGSENAVFVLQDGASIANVIIGADSLEGVHCLGSCTLKNVWFRDVCEDAISILGPGDALIVGGGAREAIDKVVQHNNAGTVTIRDYTVVNAGKLYRSCGDCTNNSKKSPRKVIVENVRAFGLTSDLVGINPNFGDSASISGSCGQTKTVCSEYKGVDKGNGKSQKLDTKDNCNGTQGKLDKLPECDAAETPTTTIQPSSTPIVNTTLPIVTSTLITKTSATPTPTQGSGDYGNGNNGGHSDNGSVPWLGRCGGEGHKGATTCRFGSCARLNRWLSVCL